MLNFTLEGGKVVFVNPENIEYWRASEKSTMIHMISGHEIYVQQEVTYVAKIFGNWLESKNNE